MNRFSFKVAACLRASSIAMCGVALSGAPAFGQSTATPLGASPPSANSTSIGLEDIVVTARRSSENLQRVPVAATVLGAVTLERQKVNIASDLQYNTPSLVIVPEPLAGSSTPIFNIRGIGQALGTDNTVVSYLADVAVDSRIIASGVYDLASVQVLRGPQGTLFGKNSTGGAVLFTPKAASTSDWSGFASADFGNYSERQLTGAVNVPLVRDVLGIRLSGQITRQDGFVKNLSGPDGNDRHYEGARLVVAFTPTDGLRNDTVLSYFHANQHNNPPITKAIGGAALFIPDLFGPGNVAAVQAQFQHQQDLGNRTIDAERSVNPDKNRSFFVSNITAYTIGAVTLKNIFGYAHASTINGLNQASIQYPLIVSIFDRKYKQVSDELQISGTSLKDDLRWIVGGYVSDQRQHYDNMYLQFSELNRGESIATDRYTSKAIFGQATLDLNLLGLDGLKLTGGARHTWDKRHGSQEPATSLRFSNQATSWTVGLDYQVNSKVLAYIVSRHSYKAGGFNLLDPSTPRTLLQYRPETLTDVEIGVKAQADIGRVPLRANLALYRASYKNMQTFTAATCPGAVTPTTAVVLNAGKGTPKGLELELEVKPTSNLGISGFYNRTLGRYNNFTLPSVAGCSFSAPSGLLDGQNFGNINKNTAGATVTYRVPLGRDQALTFTGNLYYRDRRIGNDLSAFASPLAGYTLLNARLDYSGFLNRNIDVGVYVKNLTNKLYAVERNNSLLQGGYDIYYYGDPRTYGVSLKFNF